MFSNDWKKDEDLEDLLSTEVVEDAKPNSNANIDADADADADAVVSENEMEVSLPVSNTTRINETVLTTKKEEKKEEKKVVESIINSTASIVSDEGTTNSNDGVVVVSDDLDGNETITETGTLMTINMDDTTITSTATINTAEEDPVIFMGWRNRGIDPDDISVATDNSTIGSQPQPQKQLKHKHKQNPMNRLKKKKSGSVSEKPKKNLWQELSSNVRWRPSSSNSSFAQKKSNRSIDDGNDKNTGQEKRFAEIVVNLSPTSNEDNNSDSGSSSNSGIGSSNSSSCNGLDGKMIFKSDSENNVIINQMVDKDKPTTMKDGKDDTTEALEQQISNNDKDGSIDDQHDQNPISVITNSVLGFIPSSPVKQQRKKTFVRKINIQPKGTMMHPQQQPSVMNDDIMMQKEFVQIKPFYAYPEGFQMSDAELYQEMMRKSQNFHVLESSGQDKEKQIGSLQVEVLSCMGLPQYRRTKPNSIAYLVCGDVAFATDAINSSLSPMWPVRSKRAASFPLFHAYAQLYVGIFSVTDKDNDDYAGRSTIDIATLRPNIDYDVALPLKSSGLVYDREPRGVVRLRFRLNWNKESAAVLSYIPSKIKEILVDKDEPVSMVTIPCIDAKSIRNVAFTVYGEDLPGKYSKKAWKAINREMHLYKFHIPILLRNKLLKMMRYEKPIVSLYIFIGWMALLHFRTYYLVPSYLVSLLVCIHVCNYHDLASRGLIQTGYEPLSLTEIFYSLIPGSPSEESLVNPLHTQCSDQESYLKVVGDVELPVQDHLEFPFSESKYTRMPLKSMFCPKVSNKKRSKHSSGRSIGSDWVDDSVQADRESVESDNDSISEREENINEKDNLSKLIPSGPEQDDKIETKENTFQENVNEIENVLHSLTGNLFHEQVSRSIPRSNESLDNSDKGIPGVQANKFTNPLAVLSAAFLEPVIHAINVYILAVRSIFNITSWKDPYLSFWFLVVLVFLMVALALFPWRSFFFCSGLVMFGPQNFLLKMSLIEFLFRNDKIDKPDTEDRNTEETNPVHNKREQPKSKGGTEIDADNTTFNRPLFSTQHGLRQIKKKIPTPLEVVVPYSRARRDRFYFWPPYGLQSMHETESSTDTIDLAIKKKSQ